MGWVIAAVFILILISGNAFLFSGELSSDLAGNGIAWVIVLCAIAMDIFIIYSIGKGISQSWQSSQEEAARKKKELQRSDLESLIERFTPENPLPTKAPVGLSVAANYLNQEINETVSAYRRKLSEAYQELDAVNTQLRSLLGCKGYVGVDQKLSYLHSRMAELENLKAKSNAIKAFILKHRIKLISTDDGHLQADLEQAFKQFQLSEKCYANGQTVQGFFPEKQPSELDIFEFSARPITILFGGFYFCLFSDTILVFDSDGLFSAAIDPTAMSVDVTWDTELVQVTNGKPDFRNHAAKDSKLVQQGSTRYSWWHTCRDGSPDLRYSHNPMYEYRADTYQYATVHIAISGYEVSITASSSTLGTAFERIATEYIRRCDIEYKLVPTFLALVKELSADDEQLKCMIEGYLRNFKPSGRFCELVEL